MKIAPRFFAAKTMFSISLLITSLAYIPSIHAQDLQADNMLVYQRAVGGWPKNINEVKLDYSKKLFEEQTLDIRADSLRKDATIDNGATIKEIHYLVKAYKKYNNKNYLAGAEKGVRYLLKAQYPIGGWPQFYPDTNLYRAEITYNDNAMVNVLNLLMDIQLGIDDMDVINRSYVPRITDAIKRGIQCILLTQIKVKGKPTVWCSQYNQKTLVAAKARNYELPSLSGSESVGIVEFLMRVEKPSPQVKAAVANAIEWFNKSKIIGFRYGDYKDSTQPNGKDRGLIPDPNSVVWARFYEIETNEPFFTGRDSQKKKKLSEIEYERRNGYAYYGIWPKKLLETEYPEWLKKNS